MKSEPFEIWFPDLHANSILLIGTSDSRAIFATKAAMLWYATGAAEETYASGALYEYTPDYRVTTAIASARAQPASEGDEKYYVSHLVIIRLESYPNRQHKDMFITGQVGKLYLIFDLNTGGSVTSSGNNSEEEFVLEF
jgi:hypothetical protein